MKICIAGQVFEVSDYLPGFWKDAAEGRWEPYTFDVLRRYVPKHDTYLDLGAWIGPTALYASRFCRRCIAIEPDPIAFGHLQANVTASGADIQLINEAVLDYAGTALLGSEELGNSMTRLEAAHPGGQVIEVPCRPLDSLFAACGDSVFIKMDVEGAEELILQSLGYFSRYMPTLYLSVHSAWFRNPSEGLTAIANVGSLYTHRHTIAPNTLLFTNLSD